MGANTDLLANPTLGPVNGNHEGINRLGELDFHAFQHLLPVGEGVAVGLGAVLGEVPLGVSPRPVVGGGFESVAEDFEVVRVHRFFVHKQTR